MHVVDSHFHWWPRALYERLCARKGYPRAARNERGGYTYWRIEGKDPAFDVTNVWFELDEMLARMDKLGHRVDVISSIGPICPHFSDLPTSEGRDDAMLWNEQMAAMQRQYPGRFRGAAAVPLVAAETAIEVLDHAVETLGLVGVCIPGSIGNGGRIDAEHLEPFYDRVEALGVPLFLHPTDTLFADLLDGYDGALYLGLGRVIDVSVAASRLIYSGLMDRHPGLKVFMSHTGGALPYQSGRMDKSFSKGVKLAHPTSTYIKRMYTDTVSAHAPGMKFAVEYYGADHVLYGDDYPCWDPDTAMELFASLGLTAGDQEKIFRTNAERLFGLSRNSEADAAADAVLAAGVS
ncbi:MAG: amidohydrolase family protein [Alphaproteobacteria bacterium]|nr:amidohydrolase family protein [Alphaproteobacteria bacterium]